MTHQIERNIKTTPCSQIRVVRLHPQKGQYCTSPEKQGSGSSERSFTAKDEADFFTLVTNWSSTNHCPRTVCLLMTFCVATLITVE